MPRKGRNFELDYKWLYELEKEKYIIKSPGFLVDKVTGEEREFDVLLEYTDSKGFTRRIAIECRNRNKIQDSTWIEQLKTKKEDCDLDFLIATTTTSFNNNAIKKATAHGILIERAECFSIETIKKLENEFFLDIYFVKSILLDLDFLINNKKVKYKELITSIPFYQAEHLKDFINTELYLKIDPGEVLRNNGFKEEDFYKDEVNNNLIIEGNDLIEENNGNILNILGIKAASYSIKFLPRKITLPLSKSISVFEVEHKKNKKYRAIFGNADEYLEIGYMDNNSLISQIKLKKRDLRCIGMNLHLNTVFPNIENNINIDTNELLNKALGEFDFSNII